MVYAHLVGAGGGNNIRFPVLYYQYVEAAVFVFKFYLGVSAKGIFTDYLSVLLYVNISAPLVGKIHPYAVAKAQQKGNQYNEQVVS